MWSACGAADVRGCCDSSLQLICHRSDNHRLCPRWGSGRASRPTKQTNERNGRFFGALGGCEVLPVKKGVSCGIWIVHLNTKLVITI